MITVGMNYHVISGKEKEFEEKFEAVVSALKDASGHLSSTLWKDVKQSSSYMITSEWAEESDFQNFVSSDTFRQVTNWGKSEILAGRPVHRIYRH